MSLWLDIKVIETQARATHQTLFWLVDRCPWESGEMELKEEICCFQESNGTFEMEDPGYSPTFT